MMNLTALSWLALAAYALHILEEYTFDWRNWARAVLGLPVEWAEFYMTNSLVIVLGVTQAELAPALVLAPLAFAALMLINATFFHIMPVFLTRGRFSPGLITAVVLFYPVATAMFVQARAEGRLTRSVAFASFLIGAALMAYPILMLRLKQRPYFRQDRA
jgi:hypothetical protein